jgi:hypothetical protein
MLHRSLRALKDLGVPVNMEKGDGWAKTEDAHYEMSFLGITFNTQDWTIAISEKKWQSTRALLKDVLAAATANSKIQTHTLASLLGKLHWVCKVLPAAKPFLKEGYNALYAVEGYGRTKQANYYKVRLHKALVQDLEFWETLMASPDVERRTMMMRPAALNDTQAPLATDATPFKGGAAYKRSWFTVDFKEKGLLHKSIMFKELYMMIAAVMTWGHKLENTQFIVWGDNKGAIGNMRKEWSRDADMHHLLKQLATAGFKHNLQPRVRWLSTKDNTVADLLSRNKRIYCADLCTTPLERRKILVPNTL